MAIIDERKVQILKRFSPERLSAMMQTANYTAPDLARAMVRIVPGAKVTSGLVNSWLRSDANPTARHLAGLSMVFGCPIDDLYQSGAIQ